jgi:hypothetical protein
MPGHPRVLFCPNLRFQGVARDNLCVIPPKLVELVSGHLCELGRLLKAGDAAVFANGIGPRGDGEADKGADF